MERVSAAALFPKYRWAFKEDTLVLTTIGIDYSFISDSYSIRITAEIHFQIDTD